MSVLGVLTSFIFVFSTTLGENCLLLSDRCVEFVKSGELKSMCSSEVASFWRKLHHCISTTVKTMKSNGNEHTIS